MKRWPVLEKVLLAAFLFWSAAGLIFTLGHISTATVAGWKLPSWLAGFIGGCIHTGDPILLLLAFANTHLHAARQWTPALARRWAAIVLVCSLIVETLGAATGFPFGTYYYTHRFGPMIGLVPLTIPLAWHVVITNALFIVRSVGRNGSRLAEAVGAALISTIYDYILEPFATGQKLYWIWSGGDIPLQNYVAWFVLSGLLVWAFAPTASTRFPRDRRPALILLVTVLIFVAGTWG